LRHLPAHGLRLGAQVPRLRPAGGAGPRPAALAARGPYVRHPRRGGPPVIAFVLQTASPFSALLVRLESLGTLAREGALVFGVALLVLIAGWFLAMLLGL